MPCGILGVPDVRDGELLVQGHAHTHVCDGAEHSHAVEWLRQATEEDSTQTANLQSWWNLSKRLRLKSREGHSSNTFTAQA